MLNFKFFTILMPTFSGYCFLHTMNLVYAMLGLCAQGLLASFYVITLIATSLVTPFIASASQIGPYAIDLLSLGSSVCLFITRYMMFTSGICFFLLKLKKIQ